MNQKELNEEYKDCLKLLWSMIPKEEAQRVFNCGYCDLGGDFLGFIDTYYHISRLLDDRYTIIDFGCAFAPQSYFFRNFKKYIGIDAMCDTFFRQNEVGGNCEYYPHTDISQWLADTYPHLLLNRRECFAIMNYVPDMSERRLNDVKKVFPNMYSFYPISFNKDDYF